MSTVFSVSLFLFLIDWWVKCCESGRVDNICSPERRRRVSVGLGESGLLTAFNVTPGDGVDAGFHEMCLVDVATCPSCVISLSFRLLNLRCCCGIGFNLFLHNPCRCDFVWISEPPYDDASGMSFCRFFPGLGTEGNALNYKSKTRAVRIWLFYSKRHTHAFTMEYKSEQNRQFFFGTSQYQVEVNLSTGSISSPFFPVTYPRYSIAEYVLTCKKHSKRSFSPEGKIPSDDDSNCRVHLTFTDFQLASSSVMEFYDGGRRIGAVSGASFRPPVIVSQTNSLMVRFCSFGQNSTGFKAVFSFVSGSAVKITAKPNTDCGGHLDNLGGTIAMVKMADSQVKSFDCIWLIKPLKNYSNFRSHLYLKITKFVGFGGDARLEIRQGLTSESPVLEKLRLPALGDFREHVTSLETGLYVSLRAVFGPATQFALTYASFSHGGCFVVPGFLCRNFRCIPEKLICDGSDHCGDNSDEFSVCYRGWGLKPGAEGRGKEGIQISGYSFPRVNDFSVIKTATTVFLLSLTGLVFLVTSLTVALYRIRSKVRRQRNLERETASVGSLQDSSEEVSVEDIVVDEPPSYEPPPNYEEVVKIPPKESTSGDFAKATGISEKNC